MVQPCHSLVPQQLFADPCSMLENTEQDSKSCCTSSATRPRFDIDTNRRIASAPLQFNLLTRLMNKPPGRRIPYVPVVIPWYCVLRIDLCGLTSVANSSMTSPF